MRRAVSVDLLLMLVEGWRAQAELLQADADCLKSQPLKGAARAISSCADDLETTCAALGLPEAVTTMRKPAPKKRKAGKR